MPESKPKHCKAQRLHPHILLPMNSTYTYTSDNRSLRVNLHRSVKFQNNTVPRRHGNDACVRPRLPPSLRTSLLRTFCTWVRIPHGRELVLCNHYAMWLKLFSKRDAGTTSSSGLPFHRAEEATPEEREGGGDDGRSGDAVSASGTGERTKSGVTTKQIKFESNAHSWHRSKL